MSAISAPNPYLLAVLLVTQARAGDSAQITFHYPPQPFKHSEAQGQPDHGESGESSSDSDSESSSDDAQFDVRPPNAKTNGSRATGFGQHPLVHTLSSESAASNTVSKPPWFPLLGIGEENLVSLLAPGRTWHKRKFELGINDLTFVGRPVYARENGSWTGTRRRKAPKTNEIVHSSDSDTAVELEQTPMSPRSGHTDDNLKQSLTMFHLVFVLQPPPLEAFARVKDVYEHVAKRLSKILKLEQSKSNYVLEQSEIMQRLKTSFLSSTMSADSYYSQVVKQSPLANAITVTFKAISQSRIAAVTLSPKISISMQIPPMTFTSYLPSLTEPQIKPGLWLTTNNEISSASTDLEAASPSNALQLAKTSTLLLQDSPQKILREVQDTEGPLAVALSNFLNQLRSTKSFHKLSVAAKISYPDIEVLVRHLMYWRKAIAIPPLHHRDTFIVSPNADMTRLRQASRTFETSFPMIPSLPKLLHMLSKTPTPYGMLIPTADHKEEYYRVLEWLLREGWVTQLRTFAYVRVSAETKKAVREKDREEHGRRMMQRLDLKDASNAHAQAQNADNIPSSLPDRPSIMSRTSSDGRQSISSSNTVNNARKHNPNTASLLVSPLRASGDESKWLAYIADSFLRQRYCAENLTDNEKEELQSHWNAFVKYFNGSEALEKMPLREGLKRKFVWDLLGRMGLNFDDGVLNQNGENKSILMTVRHW